MASRALAATAFVSAAALALVGCGYLGAPGDMSHALAEQRYYEEVERPREVEKIKEAEERKALRERQARRDAAFTPLELLAPGRCVDVTSEDWNWDNDVLCMNADGSTFFTSYEGASEFLATFAPQPVFPAPGPGDRCDEGTAWEQLRCQEERGQEDRQSVDALIRVNGARASAQGR